MLSRLFGNGSNEQDKSNANNQNIPAQDSGAALNGVECYVWDRTFANHSIGVVRCRDDSVFPYFAAGSIWAHARPVKLGPLPAGTQEESHDDYSSRLQREIDRLNAMSTRPQVPDFRSVYEQTSRRELGNNSTKKQESQAEAIPPTVTWDDVKGQDEAKQALREAIELPRTYSALYAAYGKRPSKGCLLYGPPGCGKTMLGRTLAQSLGGGEEGFRYVKGGELFNERVGGEEKLIREMFAEAKQYKRRTGIPKVIFFDEADGLFPERRQNSRSRVGYDFMVSTMGAFLTELDGLQECAAFVILATNRPEVMDPALLRDGRIDRKVRVARPDREVCADILRAGLSKAPGFQEEMVKAAVNEIYNPALCYYIAETEDRGAVRVNFHHQASGALLDGIVERTINEALQRDIAAGRTQPSGLTKEDVSKAVEASWRSTLGLDLQWLLEEVVGQQKIASIKTINGRWLGIRSSDVQEIKVKHEIERPDDLLG